MTSRLLILLGIAMVAMAQVPIPKRMLGYTYGYGKPNASVEVKVFLGPLCPDSKAAFPNLINLANYYGPNNMRLVTHLFPLPYHHNSFIAAKGAHIVSKLPGNNDIYNWIKSVYIKIDSFGNEATYNMTQQQVELKFQQLAESMALDGTKFNELMKNEDIEEDTRLDWKYAATRGIAWTPAFMVNDILIQANPSWTNAEWRKVIDPLLTSVDIQPLDDGTTCKFGQKKCEYLPGKIECCKDGEACIPNVGCRC